MTIKGRIKSFFNKRAAQRKANAEARHLDLTLYNDCVRLPYDLNDAFFTALAEGDLDTITDMLDSHPEAAKARDYPPPAGITGNRMSCYTRSTALDEAIMQMPHSIVEQMIDLGADPNIKNKGGYVALHSAACRGDSRMIDILVKRGADIHAIADNGQTPLVSALARGNLDAARRLIAHGVTVEDAQGDLTHMITGMGLMFQMQQTQINLGPGIDFLCDEYGADINKKDAAGSTLLCRAVEQTLPAYIITLLIQKGAKPDMTDAAGNTPLHIAASRTSSRAYAAIDALCLGGADTLLPDAQGLIASDIAQKAGDGALPAILADTQKRQEDALKHKAITDTIMQIETGTQNPVRAVAKIRIDPKI